MSDARTIYEIGRATSMQEKLTKTRGKITSIKWDIENLVDKLKNGEDVDVKQELKNIHESISFLSGYLEG